MKISEMRQMSAADAWKFIRESLRDLAKMRLSFRMGQELNVAKMRDVKRNISRMRTILSEKQS